MITIYLFQNTDNTPPQIECPRDVEVDTIQFESIAFVDWELPKVTDNSEEMPFLYTIPYVKSPNYFPIGKNEIKYVAKDLENNEASCLFTITVRGDCY